MKHLPFHNVSISSSVDEIVNEDLRIDLEISRDQRYDQLSNTKGIKFIQLNVVSLVRHLDDIRSILYSNDIHICALNETID